MIGLLAFISSGCDSAWRWWYDGRWISPLHQEHPLVGRIWVPSEGRFATTGEVYAALADADFVLVGEKHDNGDHHRYQSAVVREMFLQGRQPVIVFEMLIASQQAALDAHLADHPGDSKGIGKAVGWEARGWPRWRMYQPITDVALAHDAPLVAGGLDRETTRAVSSQGMEALEEDRVRDLRLDEPIGEAMRGGMRNVIYESHCRHLPEQMLDPMVNVTLAKDAAMAEAMIGGRAREGSDSALLIAGTGHVRADWGVPFHLRRLAPEARTVAIGLVEVVAGETDAGVYAAAYGEGNAFDFIWFAPRVTDEDPCEAFAEQLDRMRTKAGPPPEPEPE
jgi:uncharacterized iron-regulated protein